MKLDKGTVLSFVEYTGTFYRLLHPRPTLVLVTSCPDNRYNLMPASWNMPISEEPPTVGVAVYRENYTFRCLEHIPEATLNVAGPDQVDLIYKLGSVSGKDVDKVRAFSVRLVPSELISVPGWADALAIYESRVIDKVDVGESRLYVFEVLKVKVRAGVSDKWGFDLTKANLLLHGAGRTFYRVDPRYIRARG